MTDQLRRTRRSKALLRAVSEDFLLREQFVTEPAGLLADYLGDGPPSEEAAGIANQLLYSIVSNPSTMSWMMNNAGQLARSSDAELSIALAGIGARSGDVALVASLMRGGSSSEAGLGPALDLIRVIGGALGGRFGGIGGTEFTPGTGTRFTPGTGTRFTPGAGTEFTPGTGTEFTPGTGTEFTPGTGTNVSPGTGTNVSPGTGTNVSPGTGTEISPGTGTNVSPGTGTNVSPGTGTNVSPGTGTNVSPGTGTNVSPGTGTNVSPGTGTNVSPGTGTGTEVSIGGFGRFGELAVVLEALVEFAGELRTRGMLTHTGFA